MPNGAYNPQCFNCDFFHSPSEVESLNRRWCQKHDFVMPSVGGELICRDWQRNSQKTEIFASPLESEFLYHYSYAVPDPPEKLKDFQSLQDLIIGSTIHRDKNYGWVLYVEKSQYQHFPEPGKKLRVRLNRTDHEFMLVEAPRKIWAGDHRMPSGQWEHRYKMRTQRMIYCPKAPKLLCEWLDTYIVIEDIIVYKQAHEHAVSLLALGFFVFVELVEETNLYVLYPNLFMCRDFRRSESPAQ